MSEYESFRVDTTCGEFVITPTANNHIYVGTEYVNGQGAVVFRVEYNVHAHFYLWSDGKWNLGEEGKTAYDQRQAMSMTRHTWQSVRDMYASRAAYNRLAEELDVVVNEWAETHRLEIAKAEVGRVRKLVNDAAKRYNDAKTELYNARENLDQMNVELDKAASAVEILRHLSD